MTQKQKIHNYSPAYKYESWKHFFWWPVSPSRDMDLRLIPQKCLLLGMIGQKFIVMSKQALRCLVMLCENLIAYVTCKTINMIFCELLYILFPKVQVNLLIGNSFGSRISIIPSQDPNTGWQCCSQKSKEIAVTKLVWLAIFKWVCWGSLVLLDFFIYTLV